jgi:hypothetical protein
LAFEEHWPGPLREAAFVDAASTGELDDLL